MPRTALLASAAAALAAASIGAAVVGSPVGSASAAAPFSITKSQYTSVRTTANTALTKAKANDKALKALQNRATVAGVPGPKGDPGAPGGFDPAKIIRVGGPSIPVVSDEDYSSYSMDCPVGTVVMSGGFSLSTTATEKLFRVAASYPHSDLGGWSFRFAYSAAAGNIVNVTPYLLCAAS